MRLLLMLLAIKLLMGPGLLANEDLSGEADAPSTEPAKVYVGYQGWFNAEGDGADLAYRHYGGARFAPGHATVEMWPDVTDLSEGERYPTPFEHADGSTATVFSSANPRTVTTHFEWMDEFGIDGAFVQRFGSSLRNPKVRNAVDVVLGNCRNAANETGVEWSLMYDLSGLRKGEIRSLLTDDFKRLVAAGIREDSNYIHHNGKPLVGVWGIGFNDGREYELDECAELVRFLKEDPEYGGNAVMIGVPYWWRRLHRDAVSDARLHEIAEAADILSPWSVGRHQTPEKAAARARDPMSSDVAWLDERDVDYLPVLFPGFSWSNLMASRGKEAEFDAIPRRGGRFFWAQAVAAQEAGAEMVYVAMFDEIDEATAIFKVSATPPVGETLFLTYSDLPSDHYLWLTREIGRMLRGESSLDFPKRRDP